MIPPWKNDKVRLAYERPEIRASIEIILSVFTVVFLLTLAIRPTLDTIATLQKKIDDQTTVDTKLSTKITQLGKANADLGTYADRIADYSSAVPDTPDQSGVTKRITLIANENGVVINGLTLGPVPLIGAQINLGSKTTGDNTPPTEKDGKVAHFTLDFDVSGSPTSVFNFMDKLETMDRVAAITQVDLKKEIEKTSGTSVVNSLRAVGKAEMYYVLTPPKPQ